MIDSPLTPPIGSPTSQHIFDSPFSDYFTDASRSPEPAEPTPVQRLLLRRLRAVAAQIRRKEPHVEAAASLNAHLECLEASLAAPESQSRQPADVADSGLFLEDDDDVGSDSAAQEALARDLIGEAACDEHAAAFAIHPPREGNDAASREAQAVLTRVTESLEQLRKKYEDLKRSNYQLRLTHESASAEILQLRSSNESLRADLSFDHSELLFLKLQLRGLEAHASSLSTHVRDPRQDAFLKGLDRWKADWNQVDSRLRERRDGYCGMIGCAQDPFHECGRAGHAQQDQKASVSDGLALPSSSDYTALSRPTAKSRAHSRRASVPWLPSDAAARFTDEQRRDGSSTPALPARNSAGRVNHVVDGQAKLASSSEPSDIAKRHAVSESIRTTSPLTQLWDALSNIAGIYDY